jgi:seryl-tRNA synthetase
MWTKIKRNFENGVEKVRWFSSLLSDRFKIEISVMKLLYESDQMEKKRDELLKTIGRRVFELRESSERHILKDRIISESISEIEQISGEIETTKKKASEISST